MPGRILVVDDDKAMCELIQDDLGAKGFEILSYTSAASAFEVLKRESFDVVLADMRMPNMDGLSLCDRIRANWPQMPVVIMTAFGSLEAAIEAIRAGAYDFVIKPIRMDMLAISLERAVKYHSLQETVKTLSEKMEEYRHCGELIGTSDRMRDLYDRVRKVAETDSSVLIVGESGTGKELLARTLHSQSRRANGPFVGVNCASFPPALLESELFGHVRGAFTDAKEEHKGLFIQANGGTLLLDEIAEFPLMLQPKILRALEERSIRPVGSSKEIPFDVRVIAITNRDLESAVEDGTFRQDLYYRINVIQMEVPALRARRTDVLLLAQHFIDHFRKIGGKQVTGMSQPVAERLLAYDWPGNVRELRNVIEHAVALTPYEQITVEDLPNRIRAYRPSQIVLEATSSEEVASMEEVERRYILHVLNIAGGNRTRAAHMLGLSRRTLHRKLSAYGAPVTFDEIEVRPLSE